jgi:hypothetical protein
MRGKIARPRDRRLRPLSILIKMIVRRRGGGDCGLMLYI